MFAGLGAVDCHGGRLNVLRCLGRLIAFSKVSLGLYLVVCRIDPRWMQTSVDLLAAQNGCLTSSETCVKPSSTTSQAAQQIPCGYSA